MRRLALDRNKCGIVRIALVADVGSKPLIGAARSAGALAGRSPNIRIERSIANISTISTLPSFGYRKFNALRNRIAICRPDLNKCISFSGNQFCYDFVWYR